MASTISVNFATPEEVYIANPPSKKSISARTLNEVLGGGSVGGGYIQLTGTLPNKPMTGFLTLTSLMPKDKWHAVPKKYVDDHSYTRRYYYEVDNTKLGQYGYFASNTYTVSGLDKNSNPLYFFEKSDSSYQNAWRYIDVYRDGILQAYPSDYDIINVSTFYGGTTAIKFKSPLQNGANVQINIGNVGAYPVTFGLYRALTGYGTRMSSVSGDVTISIIPEDLAASEGQIKTVSSSNRYISPASLSASPYSIKAKGLFRKGNDINTGLPYIPDTAYGGRYGNTDGKFENIETTNILEVVSDPDSESNPTKFRVYLGPRKLDNNNYIAHITFNTDNTYNVDDVVNGTVVSLSRTISSFDFFVYDSFFSTPLDIYEINITVI
jgi:hypothetical protein